MARVKISTALGDIIVRLYDETPAHRDNFLKLAREGFYDGTLFHRVIKDFMIQGGDPQSKGAPAGKALGSGDAGYTLPAEFTPSLFHKRGALSAARLGDEVNPERRSSGCQFYIVWGKTYSQGEMGQMARQMEMQAQQQVFNALAMEHKDAIMQMRRNRDRDGLMALQEKLIAQTEEKVRKEGLGKMSDAAREAYATVGGTPFLDGQYTVFGEVEAGLNVVDDIQQAATDGRDRPLSDIPMTVTVLD